MNPPGMRSRPSLRLTIAIILSGIVLLTTTAVIAVSYFTTRSATLETSRALMAQVAELTHRQAQNFLESPRVLADATVKNLQSGALDPGDLEDLEAQFFDALLVVDSIASLYYATPDGDFFMVRRMPDGSLLTKVVDRSGFFESGVRIAPQGDVRIVERHREIGAARTLYREVVVDADPYDPRTRPWYKGVAESGDLHWTDVYVFHTDGFPGITVGRPQLSSTGELMGVVGVDIKLVDVSAFLSQLKIGKSGTVVLFDRTGRYVAGPDASDMVADGDDNREMRSIAKSTIPEVRALADLDAFHEALSDSLQDDAEHPVRYEASDATYIGTLRSVAIPPNQEWVIAVLVPERDFLAALETAQARSVFVGSLFLLLAIGFSVLVSRWISKSLRMLVVESTEIRALRFDERRELRSSFSEVDDVLLAFESMKAGLRQFRKYLPVKLVRQLLEQELDQELGGELQEVTIFFSDVRDFTSVCETTPPKEMAVSLGRYLERLTEVVESNNGTVIEYVGDAIMALFGAPTEVPLHPVEACKAALAALDAQRALQHEFPALPDFYTRIGIHTATVAVGHFGSENRMYYGALGDGVNTAARLESANKTYGTQLLVSEGVHRVVAEHFVTRCIDLVAMKGKTQSTQLFEVLAARESASPAQVRLAERYTAAFSLYQQRAFDEAEVQFAELEAEFDDVAAGLLVRRCRTLRDTPPPEDWNGVFKMTRK